MLILYRGNVKAVRLPLAATLQFLASSSIYCGIKVEEEKK